MVSGKVKDCLYGVGLFGVMTLNPGGLHHEPHPSVRDASRKHWQKDTRLEFTAVNIDAERALTMTEAAIVLEVPDYYMSGAPTPASATAF